MELWSLLHFLMPYIFRSRKEFSYWFSNPMNNIIEGNTDRNDDVIKRLHGIIRPFILRRLKKDVETQMPGKYEHVVKCPLSRRQVGLLFGNYVDFPSCFSLDCALRRWRCTRSFCHDPQRDRHWRKVEISWGWWLFSCSWGKCATILIFSRQDPLSHPL